MYQEVLVPGASVGTMHELLGSPRFVDLLSQPSVRLGRISSGLSLIGMGASGARQVRRHIPDIADIVASTEAHRVESGNCVMAPCQLSREYQIPSLLLDIALPRDQSAFMALSPLEQCAHMERVIGTGWRKQLEFLAADTAQAYYRDMFIRNYVESVPDIRITPGCVLRVDADGLLARNVRLVVNRRLSGPWFAGIGSAAGHGLCEAVARDD